MTTATDPRVSHFEAVPQGKITPGLFGFYGAPGTIKSTIAASFPKPMVYYDFERGLHRAWGVRLKVTDNGTAALYNGEPDQISVYYPTVPAKSLTKRWEKLDGWTDAWQAFTTKFTEDFENPDIKTVVWDTATMEWALCCDAFLEEIQQKTPSRKQLQIMEYREPNARQTSLMGAALIYRKNLVLLHHEADEYGHLKIGGQVQLDDDGNPKSVTTGKKIPDGFKYTVGKCDWVFHTRLDTGSDGKMVARAKCEKSALGLDLIGNDFDWLTYASLEQALGTLGRL
jgi:hypothetical protein